MMYWGGDVQWWGYLLMTLSMVVFWGLVIWGIIALVRYLGRAAPEASQTQPAQPTPEQILAERLARGELDEEEYQRRLETLHGHRQPVTRS